MKRIAASGVAISAALALGACSGGVAAGGGGGEEDTITVSFNDMSPQDFATGQAAVAMFDAVAEEYDGNLEVDYYWSNAMVPGDEVLSALESGMLDFGMVTMGYYQNDLPIASWSEQMSVLTPNTPGYHVPVSSNALTRLFREDIIMDEFAENGAEPLIVASTGAYSLQCADEYEDLDDASGALVRAASPTNVREIEALDMNPVSMSNSESYEGLQRGVIDCTIGVLAGAKALGHFEHLQSVVPGSLSAAQQVIAMSGATADRLPDDLVELFRTVGIRTFLEAYSKIQVQDEADIVLTGEAGPDSGVSIDVFEEVESTLDDFHTEMMENHADSAPGSIEDPEALMERYRDIHDAQVDAFERIIPVSGDIPENAEEFRGAYEVSISDMDAYEEFYAEIGDHLTSVE